MSLLSLSELAAVQDVAESGMVTPAAVYHLVTTQTENGQVSAYQTVPAFTVLGWLREITSQMAATGVNSGEIGTLETHRLLAPLGSDIRNGDQVIVGGVTFVVQHTSAGDTYTPYLAVAMKTFE